MVLKSTGIVRKVDELGRIVLPIELRRTLDIEIKDPLEIYVEGDAVILKKYEPACVFCGETQDTVEFGEKTVCIKCTRALGSLAGRR
ncbi:MAG: AbrB/MazE/SpoVT family DNA-binding domain-containing protein [Oscillospiraceae bacterium]|nr:AbrB/MazE/SpoVT family DNA-binding domain-containing protein [Oscillospiraceae bacterium]